MSKLSRVLVTAVAVVAAAAVSLPDVAQASVSVDVGFVIPGTTYTVGDTDIPASLTIRNSNSIPQNGDTNTVCNSDTSSPPCLQPGVLPPANDKGVNLLMSCGVINDTPVTCQTPDPGVFEVDAIGTGAAGTACAGQLFDIVESDPASTTFRFTPQGGANLQLAAGATCIIGFEIDVVGMPTIDQSPGVPGIQTAQIADVLVYSGALSAYASSSNNVTISRAVPRIVTQASPAVGIGGSISDTALISGRAFPDATANVHFDLYGPNDDNCTGPPVFSSDVNISDTASQVTSAPFTPTRAGTYRWIARYDGDTNNESVTGACNDENENVVVSPAQPALATVASAGIRFGGGTLTDTATVTGRVGAVDGATVDFRLYGPNDATCTNAPVFVSLGNPISATSNVVTSAAFTPTAPGTYRWIASYSGDINNLPAVGACNDVNESVDVSKALPEITTQTSPGVAVGKGVVTDTATVTGRVSGQAGATIDFRLYGPNDASCSGAPVFQDLGVAYPASGGTVRSAPFTPTVIGTYRWIATYSGDANNASVVGTCGDPGETFSVTIDEELQLPATGASSNLLLRTGGITFLLGLALVGLTGRRRRPVTPS